jgi:type I restriction-modification system DNA methylase subunit
LLEVWAQRDQIAIDPETYATLKRKARALVRDFRGFDLRDEVPDSDWQVRRLDLLGIDWSTPIEVTLEDGTVFRLLVWRDDDRDALLIADLPGAPDPDVRPPDAADPLATQFELALDAYEGGADWGILLAGTNVRVYRRSSGISQQYLELSLDDLVELDDENAWRAFAAVFRTPAFAYPADGTPLIVRVVDESRRHATALAADMRTDVIDAAEVILQDVLRHPANSELIGIPGRPQLQRLFEETLYYLYRVLFVLYAESRDVLRVDGADAYATTYSLQHLIDLARTNQPAPGGVYYMTALKRLFDLLWHGPASLAHILNVDPVGGDLFDPSKTGMLDDCLIDDMAWSHALTSIALGAPGTIRRRQGQYANFAELGVDQLGSIYEGLLVLEPYLAPGPRLLANVGGERRVLELEAAGDYRVLRHLEAGDFVLESASGRRKGSGSFYTPHEITEFLTHAVLDSAVEPLVSLAADDQARAAGELLALRVCDPAMGSGAFLVQAARVLGRGLARIRAARQGGRVTPEMVRKAERQVVRECIYGVDLNPLAVALAKVSLWLETLEPGRPLSFLDAHLRCGDSLVGVNFSTDGGTLSVSELVTWPATAHKGLERYLKAEAGPAGDRVLARLKNRKPPKKPKQATLPGMDAPAIQQALENLATDRANILASEAAVETLEDAFAVRLAFHELEKTESSVRNRLRMAADFWCAQWFSNGEDSPEDDRGPVAPATVGEFDSIMGCIIEGRTVREALQAQVEAAGQASRKRRFFHWALEFPEVMVDRGGFDAVIGNPPWNTLSPDVKEFFSTYDPHVFRRGIPKARQEQRKIELRKDLDIDVAWRSEARWLHELSNYAKPDSGRFSWYAPDGQLRKGDANVFRLFVERAFGLLRRGGRFAQVLPDSVYISSPATGVRQHLLIDGQLERCYVFENRKEIFPIHRSVKVVLLTGQRDGGPTERFQAAFFVGKDAAGRDRAVGLDTLPTILADLEQEAPELAVDQVRSLAPATWSFPELQTALDAEIAAHCVANVPALNLAEDGWGIQYCDELHADRDAWRFKEAAELEVLGAVRDGLRWRGRNGEEWWPLVEGQLFYILEFPERGKEPRYWVNGAEVAAIKARQNVDGTSVTQHYRVTWRDVARSTDERSAIAAILPPYTASKHTSPTTWGGSLDNTGTLALVGLMSSFCFDYIVRFSGRAHLTHAALSSVPSPSCENLKHIIQVVAEIVCCGDEFDDLWHAAFPERGRPVLNQWEIGEHRAWVDAEVARAYGLSLEQFAAILCTFPNVDTVQPMLHGEPKSFVTRDLALLTYCQLSDTPLPDVSKLLHEIGVDLPDPLKEYRLLDSRVTAARQLGAIPYKRTPRGGRAPTDPALIEAVQEVLGVDALTPAEVAELANDEEKTVTAILKKLEKQGHAYVEGKGKMRRYYVIEDD